MDDKLVRAVERNQDDIHMPFVTASLLFGVLGGFSLATSLPIEALAGSLDVSWVAHAQVHGHIQVVGFATLFVVGMALKLAPRFGGRAVSPPDAERWLLWLLVAGLLGRAFGQPLADIVPFGILTLAGAALEGIGAGLFLVIVAAALSGAVRDRQPFALLIVGAACAFLLQSLLGLWWLWEMVADRRTFLGTLENAVLIHLQFFGVLLPAILGVGMRSFPTFFGRKPPGAFAGGAVVWMALGGIALWTAGGVLTVIRPGDWWPWTVLGQTLAGGSVLGAMLVFGPWRTPSRLARASKGLGWAIHPAVLWLAVTGVLLSGVGLQSLVAHEATDFAKLDAIRYIFGIGAVTLAIVGMAQLILPEFASERLVRRPGNWRGPFFGGALSVAAALRGVVLLAGLEGDLRWWAMAVAGALGWVAVATFALLVWRAARSHRAYLERLRQAREQKAHLAAIPVAGPGPTPTEPGGASSAG